MVFWKSLKLWSSDEEKRIHQCLTEALQELIAQRTVKPADDEKTITGLLRPILISVRKRRKLNWSLNSEASNFDKATDPNPIGHPDIKFTRVDKDSNQCDYDIECKLVRIKRSGKSSNYCADYIKKGVMRYESSTYAQSTHLSIVGSCLPPIAG